MTDSNKHAERADESRNREEEESSPSRYSGEDFAGVVQRAIRREFESYEIPIELDYWIDAGRPEFEPNSGVRGDHVWKLGSELRVFIGKNKRHLFHPDDNTSICEHSTLSSTDQSNLPTVGPEDITQPDMCKPCRRRLVTGLALKKAVEEDDGTSSWTDSL